MTDQVCVSPLDYASSGVYITTRKLDVDKATVEIRSLVNNGVHAAMSNKPEVSAEDVVVETVIKDTAGNAVATKRTFRTIEPDCTKEIIQELKIENPHLWMVEKILIYIK